ncbi:NHLP leader peptide family RiPP precursor [Azospirillum sp. YIM B02556]|uniref:NHLP leader peptide family RiPP n=1 Tax=Azospirillum endophyticum TaxID=2800326 RepID=A0ABS1FCG6_9PROT|nr:NHLP leader peptide family RiPP precursor [Azospirillum endophyticum]MBK1841109.1 NHLP leader peptide family RiPP precursor [Azospirillum endophyticum]
MTSQAGADPLLQLRRQAEAALVDRAQSDAAFRALLVRDPHAALKTLLGTDPIPGLAIKVVEEQPGEMTLVLPATDQSELPDDLLDLASGGIKFSAFIQHGPNNIPQKPKA